MTGKASAYRIVLTQLVLTLASGLLAWAALGHVAAVAVAAGGLINVIANLYFALHVFHGGVRPADAVMRSFYVAEAAKLFLTAVLFALALAVLKLAPVPLLAGFVVTLAGYWLALLPAGPVLRWSKT